MSDTNVLITAHGEACGNLKYLMEHERASVVHLPLEMYKPKVEKMASGMLKKNIHHFSFVIYGNQRNAIYFHKWMKEYGVLKEFLNAVHLCMDKPTSEFLESNGIPSIQPRQNAQPIDILEFMLRISREGKTLYPACENRAEEMPGLLQELEMEVAEFTVCEETGLTPETLKRFRKIVSNKSPGSVLIHNRSSLTRLQAAFPDMDLHQLQVISGSAGVTKMLIDKGVEPDFEADGSWQSIETVLRENIL